MEITGISLSLFDEGDLVLFSLSDSDRKKLLSAIHEHKRREYDERKKRQAMERVEDWLRENAEMEMIEHEVQRCKSDQFGEE